MRQSPASKRARGRSGGRRPYPNSPNRSFDSSGPDVKIRGTAAHIYEKYQALARDAAASGDRVAAENYMQHAEHYFRIISANNAAQNQAPHGQQQGHGQAEQPHQHGHQGEHDGNGRAHGNNGQRPFMADADDDDDIIDNAAHVRPQRPVEASDEARTIEPTASGPTSFEPLPENPGPSQPAPQSLRELAEAAGRDAPQEAATEEGDDPERRRGGRKRGTPKDRTDVAPAG